MDSHKYDDLIGLPHHQSTTRPHMPMGSRAAQFSPFAALTGYAEAVAETARLTYDQKELSADLQDDINEKLYFLLCHQKDCPKLSITFLSLIHISEPTRH